MQWSYHSVPQIRPPPPFATLALVQSAGEAYTWDATFSLAITPSLNREMLAVLWMRRMQGGEICY